MGAATNANPDVRTSVHRTLARLDPQWPRAEAARAAVPTLIGDLAHQDAEDRRVAAELLGRIGDRRAPEPLVGALRDKDPDVRKAAVDALAQIR